jgi:hypothetical protein
VTRNPDDRKREEVGGFEGKDHVGKAEKEKELWEEEGKKMGDEPEYPDRMKE